MDQRSIKTNFLPVAILIVLAAITRFIPHPFNFTAIGAMALFSGANFKDKRLAYLMPIAVMFITDLFLGFHFSILPVYACFAFTVFMGTKIASKQNVANVAITSIASSIVFFLVTNLPFWYLDQHLYSMNLQGTILSYSMALPFFTNQILGDLFFNGVLFSVYHLVILKSSKVTA
ncbi:MAG: hypothetical protein KA285_00600 [Bacteroidia bacterium]|nr:hypothetical protein [Bacteroidia bacterium]